MDIDKLIEKYVATRDRKSAIVAEQKAVVAKYDKVLDQLEGLLLAEFNAAGVESMRTQHGTAYKTTRTSATVADWDVVLTHIQAEGLWGLLERRVNKTAVEEYREEHGTIPPGVSTRSELSINVRR